MENQSQRCSKGAADGELYALLGVRKVGELLQQQCCVSQVSARADWLQSAAARTAVGSLLSSCAGLSCPQQDSLGLPTHQSTLKAEEKPSLFVSCLVQAKVRWLRGTAGDAEGELPHLSRI